MSTSFEQICSVGRRRAYTGEKERSVEAPPAIALEAGSR